MPAFVQQNINAQAPLNFKGRLKVRVSTAVNSILGQAHYTKNDNYALKKVVKQVMVTHHKKDRPFGEGSRD